MSLRLFGLTGGVASGKSTVAGRFRDRGLEVIDADALARQVVEPGTEGLAAVVDEFGQSVLRDDGALDRGKLGAIVFGSPERLGRLNGILHPLIRAETVRRAAALSANGVALACYEAALLVENDLADQFRPLVVVAVAPQVQLERMRQRDGLSRQAAESRVAAQLPLAQKVAAADFVIENDGSLEQLRQRADAVLAQIRQQVGAARD